MLGRYTTGAKLSWTAFETLAKAVVTDQIPGSRGREIRDLAGILGLEPRLTGPEPVVLPITPYPNGGGLSAALTMAPEGRAKPYTRRSGAAKTAGSVRVVRPSCRATHQARAR